jgi:hypothetical protein
LLNAVFLYFQFFIQTAGFDRNTVQIQSESAEVYFEDFIQTGRQRSAFGQFYTPGL